MTLRRGTLYPMPLLPPAHSSTSGSRVIHRWTLTVAKGTTCFPCLSPSSPAEISAEVKRLPSFGNWKPTVVVQGILWIPVWIAAAAGARDQVGQKAEA